MSTSTISEANDPRLLRLAPEDNTSVVTSTIEAGETVMIEGRQVTVPRRVPFGHKIAVAPIPRGETVRKYGAPIGRATEDIQPGDYVHTHNVTSDYLPTFTLDGANPFLKGN